MSTITAGNVTVSCSLSADTTGNLVFQSGGNVTAMTIDTSQNVGIGTSSPSAFGGTNLQVQNSNIASILWSNGTITGQLLCSSGAEVTVGSRSNHPLRFGTNDTERGRFDADGNFLIGGTSRASVEKVNITHNGANQEGLILINTNTSAGTQTSIGFRRPSGTTVGTITTTLSATAYNTSSDYRLKHDIQPMQNALAKVAALKPVTYKWNVDDSDGEGFIAHELAEIVPDAVTGEKDAVNEDGSIKPQGIDTSFLVATLTAAIQEQQKMIETLQAEVAALKGASA